MKKNYITSVLIAIMFTILTLSYSWAAAAPAPMMGKMARLAETLAARVNSTQYTLYYQGVDVLRWNEHDSVPLIPAGEYRIICQKGDSVQGTTYFEGYLEFTAVEGATLSLAIPTNLVREFMTTFNINHSSLPDLNGQTGVGITIIYNDGSATWGSAEVNSNGNLNVQAWLNPSKTVTSMVLRIGDRTYTSNLSLDIASLIMNGPVSVNYDPMFRPDTQGISSYLAHRYWIFDGFEDSIDQAEQWRAYRVTLEAGKTYKFFTSSQSSSVGQLTDTVIGIWPGNFTGVFTNSSPNALATNDDYSSEGGNYYSRIIFTPSSTGEYLLAVRGYYNQTGGYRVQMVNANSTVTRREIAGQPESTDAVINDNASGLSATWSMASAAEGNCWFYAYGDNRIAVANVGAVSQIKDASAFRYVEGSVGPVGINGIVLIHNTRTGYYGAIRVRNVYDDNPNERPNGYLSATTYIQSNGTGDFSQ
jgi:hypothetical protein